MPFWPRVYTAGSSAVHDQIVSRVLHVLGAFTGRGPHLDLVKVPLGLSRSLNGCGERGIIAQHQQPPLGSVVGLYHLGAHKLRQKMLPSSARQCPPALLSWLTQVKQVRDAMPALLSNQADANIYPKLPVGGSHLGRDVLRAQLCFHMGVIELADEGVCPGLTCVYGDMHVVLSVPLSSFLCDHSPNHQRGCFRNIPHTSKKVICHGMNTWHFAYKKLLVPPHLIAHGQGVLYGGGHVSDVPGVHKDGTRAQGLGSASKLTQHKHTCIGENNKMLLDVPSPQGLQNV